jgi:hypothetical protein
VIPTSVGDAEIVSEIQGDGWAIPSTGAQRAQMAAGDLSLPRVVRSLSRPWAVARQRFPTENLRNVLGAFLADRISVAANGALYDGQGISQWTNVKAVSPSHINQGTAALQPLLKLGARASRPSVLFDGVDDVMTGAATSTFIPDAGVNPEEFSVFCVFKATGPGGSNDDTGPQLNPGLWADSTGLIGMSIKNVAGQNYLQSYLKPGGVFKVINNAIALNTWYIAHMYQTTAAGVLYAGIRCFTNASIAAGNVGIGSGGSLNVGKGHSTGAYFKGEMYALIFDAKGDLGQQGSTAGYVGGGWRHLIYESLADMLRISEAGWV